MSRSEDLARAVDAAAAAVEGVARLYPTAPVPAGALRAVLTGVAAPFSAVTDGDPVEVLVSIGVAEPAPSGATAALVAEAARTAVGEDADIRVRVSRVHGGAPEES